ncbi:MAG: BMP family ABC transporter substrate-binding protein [Pseudomonadota bacterium]
MAMFFVAPDAIGNADADDAPFRLGAPPKIGMVLYSQRSDGGWISSFDLARKQMEQDLGQPIDYYNNVESDSVRVIAATERLIAQGSNIIIGTSYNYSAPFAYLADRHPNIAFLNGGGVTNGRNLQSFYGRAFDSQYLCGMIAGAMSKKGKLGFVAAFDVPVVVQSLNGFTLGARQSKPEATVDVRFTNAWADPNAEQNVTLDLIDAGADVIGGNVDTPRPQVVAQARGVFATGHNRDLIQHAPKATLCSSVWYWARYLTPTIRAIAAGTWKPEPDVAIPDFKDGPSDIVINRDLVPKDIYDRVMIERMAIINGKNIFEGPLKNNKGVVVVAKGKALSTAEIYETTWHVEGVVTPKIPTQPAN